jgi:hypothetical protein
MNTKYSVNGSKWFSDFIYKNEEFVNTKTGQVIDATP